MNHTSDRYDYPVSSVNSEMPIIPYPDLKFSERPGIVPPEVDCPYVLARALSPKLEN